MINGSVSSCTLPGSRRICIWESMSGSERMLKEMTSETSRLLRTGSRDVSISHIDLYIVSTLSVNVVVGPGLNSAWLTGLTAQPCLDH